MIQEPPTSTESAERLCRMLVPHSGEIVEEFRSSCNGTSCDCIYKNSVLVTTGGCRYYSPCDCTPNHGILLQDINKQKWAEAEFPVEDWNDFWNKGLVMVCLKLCHNLWSRGKNCSIVLLFCLTDKFLVLWWISDWNGYAYGIKRMKRRIAIEQSELLSQETYYMVSYLLFQRYIFRT